MTAHATASKLDMAKLAKLRALMDRGATPGEREAARAKAIVLAASAGLTLAAALSKLDAPAPAAQPANIFTGFADWMEEREPGYKVREAARRAEREAKRLARCRELLAVYGSEDAVFAPTDLEAAIRDALDPLTEPGNSLWGYRDFKFSDGPTPEMWEALRVTGHVPATVPKAWAAYQAQEARTDNRIAFCPDYTPMAWESAWSSALEYLLDNLRTPTAEGIAARLDWLEFLANRDMARGIEADRNLIASLQSDFAAFVASNSRQSGHSTAAQRRAAVLDLLAQAPGLSDREISRRAGCSPQTVGNWRRKLEGAVQ
ncbi:Homeodomain-like domain-containing protein [Paracoccus versutus]|uniref:Homeodomain-like domain-containing protein n=1 Tax=Paracoccus versutus TaxID=34007 RepID=A0AAQ0KLA9_PARVE|nr:helix-turn-helix domain-containing protein [Paracoccus versutus]REG46047.1 Homeodomain-like domain-containing protein [Paracoccus versutus]